MSKIAAPGPHGKAGARAVYVLDDDARVRSSVVYILAGGGYQPVEFSEPAPMLEQLKSVVPEIGARQIGRRRRDASPGGPRVCRQDPAHQRRDEITLNEIQG